MWRFLSLLVVLVAGCGDGPTEPEPEPSGTWRWVQNDVRGTAIDSIAFCVWME